MYNWRGYNPNPKISNLKKYFEINYFLINNKLYLHIILKEGGFSMLIIPIKEGENIDRAIKRFKRKFDKTGTKRSLQTRKEFIKPSVKRRATIQKAQYIQSLKDLQNI